MDCCRLIISRVWKKFYLNSCFTREIFVTYLFGLVNVGRNEILFPSRNNSCKAVKVSKKPVGKLWIRLLPKASFWTFTFNFNRSAGSKSNLFWNTSSLWNQVNITILKLTLDKSKWVKLRNSDSKFSFKFVSKLKLKFSLRNLFPAKAFPLNISAVKVSSLL